LRKHKDSNVELEDSQALPPDNNPPLSIPHQEVRINLESNRGNHHLLRHLNVILYLLPQNTSPRQAIHLSDRLKSPSNKKSLSARRA